MAGFVSWLRAEWDRAAGVGFLLAGAVSLAVGYAGVADAAYVPQALSFIASGGFFGLLLVAVGATLLITAALHDEWRKLDRIEQSIDRLAETLGAVDLTAPVLPSPADHPGPADQPNGRSAGPVADPPVVAAAAAAAQRRAVLAVALERSSGGDAVLSTAARPALVVGVTGLLAATGLVAGGWTATASAVHDDTAYTALLLGIAGIAVAGLTSTGATLRLRRAARARQARLLAPFGPYLAPETVPADPDGGRWVAVAEGLRRYHRPDCAALNGVAFGLVDPGEVAGSGLEACGLCCLPPGA